MVRSISLNELRKVIHHRKVYVLKNSKKCPAPHWIHVTDLGAKFFPKSPGGFFSLHENNGFAHFSLK